MIDFTQFPSPCYIMEEELLRKNLSLIKQVADKAGVEIILAFKSFAMWRSFPIFREYIAHSYGKFRLRSPFGARRVWQQSTYVFACLHRTGLSGNYALQQSYHI